ncbi:MAG: trypsin-like peptidase domain-containing protein [Pirellulaceae bacterium]
MVSLHACLLAAAMIGQSDSVLLSFTADWCGHCRVMQPTVQRLHDAGYPIREVNIDKDPDLASRFAVRPIPCFILVRDGREVERVVGEASYDRLIQMFEQVASPATPALPLAPPPDLNVRSQSPDDGSSPRIPLAPLTRGIPGPPPQSSPTSSASGATSPGNHAGNHAENPAHRQALQATVRLRVTDATGVSHGTGTIIDVHGDEALVLTCGHIFRDSQGRGEVSVELFVPGATQPVRGQLLTYEAPEITAAAPGASGPGNAPRRDAALVSIRPGVAVQPVRVASPDYRPQPGEAIFSVGCDHGADPSVRESTISAIDRYLGPPSVEIHGHPVEGRSGGGLFTSDGRIIGICNAADTQEDRGIFAGPATIHFQLKSINQERIYLAGTPAVAGSLATLPAIEPPVFPNADRGVGNAIQPVSATTAAASAGTTEVICILRSRGANPADGRVLIVDHPSEQLLQLLHQESPRMREDTASRTPAPAHAQTALGARQPAPTAQPPVIRAQNSLRP